MVGDDFPKKISTPAFQSKLLLFENYAVVQIKMHKAQAFNAKTEKYKAKCTLRTEKA